MLRGGGAERLGEPGAAAGALPPTLPHRLRGEGERRTKPPRTACRSSHCPNAPLPVRPGRWQIRAAVSVQAVESPAGTRQRPGAGLAAVPAADSSARDGPRALPRGTARSDAVLLLPRPIPRVPGGGGRAEGDARAGRKSVPPPPPQFPRAERRVRRDERRAARDEPERRFQRKEKRSALPQRALDCSASDAGTSSTRPHPPLPR